MSLLLIKAKLHELIDQLQDQEALQKLYAGALELKYELMEEDPFSEETWDEIDKGLAQIRNDEPCTYQAAVDQFMEWQGRK